MRSFNMKTKAALLIGVTAASALSLAACGGSDRPPSAGMAPPTPPPMEQDLDTASVLSIVQNTTSENGVPFEVDVSATNGGVVVTPVGDETSAPVSVDGT
jgi:hypothetical protein